MTAMTSMKIRSCHPIAVVTATKLPDHPACASSGYWPIFQTHLRQTLKELRYLIIIGPVVAIIIAFPGIIQNNTKSGSNLAASGWCPGNRYRPEITIIKLP